ncbi:hypothetical protein [Rhodohalobacter sulfatireducens]|uniref:Lipoprotein n=1 Tax=Rhodohalobacter sulfatireducens TaxID=2911366 RepID=A0ABS9KFE0_9BACT|nr:hypothetical protein [Rhodohalobacter sulfatireducens]MCG2589571.1 hypothetical protein [Rhodohalobacter sulfatireducens]
MKVLQKKVLHWSLCILLAVPLVTMTGCSEDNVFNADTNDTVVSTEAAQMLGRTEEGVVAPFKADFFTIDAALEGADPCDGSLYDLPVPTAQEGYGQGTHLGRFTTRMTFCVEVIDWANLTAPYNNLEATFIAANGDELWTTIPAPGGLIIPSDRPGCRIEFHDPFEIVGGTGRFEGAGGSGRLDTYQCHDGTRYVNEHYWYGTLILPRAK